MSSGLEKLSFGETDTHTLRRLRRVEFRVGAVLLGLVTGVGFAELGLWLLAPGPLIQRSLTRVNSAYPQGYVLFSENVGNACTPTPEVPAGDDWQLATLSGEPIPLIPSKLSETPWSLAYKYHRGGVLHAEYSRLVPPGKSRILGVGDSFALSWGVPREQGLFGQMERLLGAQCEILNVARPGLHTDEEYERVVAALAEYQCPLTIVQWLPNDIRMNGEDAEQAAIRLLDPIQRRGILAKSRTYSLVRGLFMMDATEEWTLACHDASRNAEGLRQFDAVLQMFARLQQTRVAFVLYPRLYKLESGYPYQKIHDQVAAMIRRHGMPVLDLAPVFQGTPTRTLWVHWSDTHPNAVAHEIAALAIVTWLRREFPHDVPQ